MTTCPDSCVLFEKRVSEVVRVDTFCRQTSRDHSQAFSSTTPNIWGFCVSGIQDNAVWGALQGERLWITFAYFVSEDWIYAVALVSRGLHYFSTSRCPGRNFSGVDPITKNGAVDACPCRFLAAKMGFCAKSHSFSAAGLRLVQTPCSAKNYHHAT